VPLEMFGCPGSTIAFHAFFEGGNAQAKVVQAGTVIAQEIAVDILAFQRLDDFDLDLANCCKCQPHAEIARFIMVGSLRVDPFHRPFHHTKRTKPQTAALIRW